MLVFIIKFVHMGYICVCLMFYEYSRRSSGLPDISEHTRGTSTVSPLTEDSIGIGKGAIRAWSVLTYAVYVYP